MHRSEYPSIGRAMPTRLSDRQRGGTILLEVVLAMAMFSMTAAVIFSGMSASMRASQRGQLAALASDLAVTKLSEIMLGEVELVDAGPEAYEGDDLAGWTWQVTVQPMELPGIVTQEEVQVNIAIRHTGPDFVYRLVRLLPSPGAAAKSDSMEAAYSEAGG